MSLVSGCQLWTWRTWQAALVSLNCQIFLISLLVHVFLNVHLVTKYQLTNVLKLVDFSNGHFCITRRQQILFFCHIYQCTITRKSRSSNTEPAFVSHCYNILYLASCNLSTIIIIRSQRLLQLEECLYYHIITIKAMPLSILKNVASS